MRLTPIGRYIYIGSLNPNLTICTVPYIAIQRSVGSLFSIWVMLPQRFVMLWRLIINLTFFHPTCEFGKNLFNTTQWNWKRFFIYSIIHS